METLPNLSPNYNAVTVITTISNNQTRSATWKLVDTPCFSTNFDMVHNQPNIIVSLIGAILKNNSPW